MTQYNGTDDESKVFKPEMLCDVSDEDRFTMILKVNYKGNVYICNRSNNLAIFNNIIKDKYCKWFRIKQINEIESAYEKNISIQKDIYFCIDTLIKGYESNKSNYYLTTNLLNNIHFNIKDFDSVIKSKYSFISAVNSFSIIEQNLTESSFKK